MKCPEYIREAIRKRAEAADIFSTYDWIISDWCDKNGIELDRGLTHCDVKSIVNPYLAAHKTLEGIWEHCNDE